MPGTEAPHDLALAAAVEAWCDAELDACDSDMERGTFVGEWALIVSRQGMDAEGEPATQWFDISEGGPSRKLGLLRLAMLKCEKFILDES